MEKDDYLEVQLSCGSVYKIDKEFRVLFETVKWYKGHYGYLTFNNPMPKRFHRVIMDCPKGMVVDHINRDVTDNRKCNLRVTTQKSNSRNKESQTGKYKGVSWSNHAKKWRSVINVEGKPIHLGYYKTELEAAIAYNDAVEIYFDEYAYRNVLSL